MLLTVWAVSACSGLRDPVPDNVHAPVATNDSDINEPDGVAEVSTSETTDTSVDESVESNPVVADPQITNNVLVTFEMTVPAHQSDELRIELIWGDKSGFPRFP
ncbi:MAG: hypothetical protein AB8B97_19510 [Granulosicoccus sp.]